MKPKFQDTRPHHSEEEDTVEVRVRKQITKLYDNNDTNEKRIEAIIKKFTTYEKIAELDPAETFAKLRAIDTDNREDFIEQVFILAKPFVDAYKEKPADFERITREEVTNQEGAIRLSETMYCLLKGGGRTLSLHLAPSRTFTPAENLKEAKDGMRNLAKVVSENPEIERVSAMSWIVANNPGIIEKLGFTVDGPISVEDREHYFKGNEEAIHSAHIDRETLLSKWG